MDVNLCGEDLRDEVIEVMRWRCGATQR